MLEKRKPIPVAEAVARVMEYAHQGEIEKVSLIDSYGRTLGEDVIADHDVPHFDRSPYDGFAIRAEDTKEANSSNPIQFEVIGEIGAGSVFREEVKAFQAVRIMTGAAIPAGCNAVVMLELTEGFEENEKTYMTLKRSFAAGDNISFQGEDVKQNAILVKKGTSINPGVAALLATFGYSSVHVVRQPVIGIITTGSELLEVHEQLKEGKIRNSNSYMIAAQVERAGGIVRYYGQFVDELETCYNTVKKAMKEVDILITTGGVSVGDYDYLPAIYERLRANVLFNKIAMRPGSVTTVAELEGKLLFGLSGNPSACYVGYELYVRPVIRTYLHRKDPHVYRAEAILQKDFPKANPFTRFVRGRVEIVDGQLQVTPVGLDKSSAISSLAEANACIVLPGGTRGFEAGIIVSVLLLESNIGSEWPWKEPLRSYK
ncbi:molybdopterin molybdotransferase MoeA [Bacillus nitratireducens]|uniref:Molybdopterin molybdenumtransferase n=1 Tax=Bacillus nitratireducens TaxID=2026193 RepID=A0ABU6P9M7_9BACI|nr:gephyrin-like molybdotransferase Glp [Bacillus nitratireducens]EOO79234.1 molybdenum cofactor synthesis domain-containing protein [Bacillus cereus BAG1O-1]PEX51248.1 molybdopterin molybdenumtransferase MoeA [Bacillus cereus]MDR4173261.1 molybdopterin molybdotransferase MoeA [Bacillus nitratireducens]MED4677571.1 molybdopterin molybdotransferase MoeA [Bacillus nitratireducens]PFM30019.1 molybdopterin molybdenumtransferase MoeA [Bacillus cereus]